MGLGWRPMNTSPFPRVAAMTVFIALTAGFAFRELRPAPPAKGTPVLWEFSFSELVAKTGSADWRVLEDRIYHTLPPLSGPKRIARRIVAQVVMPDAAQAAFIKQFQEAAVAALNAQGAVIKGQIDSSRSSVDLDRGERILTQLELPRRYYTVGNVQGVADYWCVGVSGRVTVIVCLMEGL